MSLLKITVDAIELGQDKGRAVLLGVDGEAVAVWDADAFVALNIYYF